ncbi:putative sulfate exporter family transporter [soil metagenome]
MTENTKVSRYLLPALGLLSLTPWISSGVSLLMGIVAAVVFGNAYSERTKWLTQMLLPISVMGLGAGMNLAVIGQVGVQGIGYTVTGILFASFVGLGLGAILKTTKDVSLLITMGTAICGGSAIAAIAPVIKAKNQEVSVALGTIFILNAAALFVFPWIGHHLSLSESQFGLWSALAIHDTSSVVGATMQYGPHAVEVGTTVKLARALWIVPVAVIIGAMRSRRKDGAAVQGKAKRPWFILGFILAAALVTWIPELQTAGHIVEMIAKRLMVLTLFLIGTSLTRATIQSVGVKPFAQGFVLWVIVASASLSVVYFGVIG